jgi:hypothetical protein
MIRIIIKTIFSILYYTGYFRSDHESEGHKNATHNTFPKITWIFVF